MNFLEIQFSLRGQTLPADHGFSLYSALKNLCHKQQPTLLNRQFKNEVHQCLMIIHRIPQKGFDSQDIFEDDD